MPLQVNQHSGIISITEYKFTTHNFTPLWHMARVCSAGPGLARRCLGVLPTPLRCPRDPTTKLKALRELEDLLLQDSPDEPVVACLAEWCRPRRPRRREGVDPAEGVLCALAAYLDARNCLNTQSGVQIRACVMMHRSVSLVFELGDAANAHTWEERSLWVLFSLRITSSCMFLGLRMCTPEKDVNFL